MNDEKRAWQYFSRTGTVRDYLRYVQCKTDHSEVHRQEDQYENRRPGPGGFGETHG